MWTVYVAIGLSYSAWNSPGTFIQNIQQYDICLSVYFLLFLFFFSSIPSLLTNNECKAEIRGTKNGKKEKKRKIWTDTIVQMQLNAAHVSV